MDERRGEKSEEEAQRGRREIGRTEGEGDGTLSSCLACVTCLLTGRWTPASVTAPAAFEISWALDRPKRLLEEAPESLASSMSDFEVISLWASGAPHH